MITFTYITAALIAVGIICILIPRKWYKNSQLDFRIGGIWAIMMTLSTQTAIWLIYGIITLVKFLFFTYVIAGSNAI